MKPATLTEYLEWSFKDAGRVELRHQHGKRWTTTWHDTVGSLLAVARGHRDTGNLFTSLQHVRTTKITEPVVNDDVDRYCRIFFDFDPVRPVNIAATEAELQLACDRARGLRWHLTAHGWPLPAVGLSGNGYHLLYRTALPNTQEIREQFRALYNGLYTRFSDDAVVFDRSVRNPGRIAPLYGTIKRKGTATSERPHRRSELVIPPTWRQVSQRQIEQLANAYAQEQRPKPNITSVSRPVARIASGLGNYASLDVVAWFTSHGLYVGHLHDHLHGVHCPWSAEHSTPGRDDGGDCVIFEASDGWPGFHCKHGHCDGRNIRDVIALMGDADQFCSRRFERRAG